MNKMNSSINQRQQRQQKKDRQLRLHGVVTSAWMVCVLLAPVHGFHLQQNQKQLMLSSSPSPISSNSKRTPSRRNGVRSTTTRTQLRYADFDDGDEHRRNTAGTAAGSTRRWALRDIMPSSSSTPQTTTTTRTFSTSTPPVDEQQQENVDAYLEFLDRRYRRLHADETSAPIGAIAPRTLTSSGPAAQRSQEQEKPQKKQQQARTLKSDDDATLSTKQSFPVLTWLLNGNRSPDKEVLSRQQQEDALYVLGVAGLASEKLLQKHHQRVRVSSTQLRADAASASASASTTVVETNASVVSSDDEDYGEVVLQSTPTTVLVKRVLVPLVRGLYIAQRRKAAIKQAVLSPLQAVLGKLWNKVQTNLQHPRSFLQSLLEVGGGRHTIIITMAIAYTAVVLVRPILQTIVTEASY
mmetsp:Transcript_41612/g.99763  ORF Transcript_41612/g.99763 Transcript_41612/m.99763 type:complete len:410 (-) Transcript_41612:277-1506(-)|eukprot:CAMPEP_0113492870 /NCGR_PEP_ID=MMETSP0014_2-20120614/28300_1 /TAXON_ID=2857 /ORGANISM="Nitzschia sp." /LENGTH=409 /DNA_ID=CAMNT_0000386717 /DNA_START=130 /DNA_END=1359 /DNA_ORIENTATION=+ /assembly_acc=CAM_ASM_000159